jgi:hypothetical protein
VDAPRVAGTASRLRTIIDAADPSLAILRGDLMPATVAILTERLGGLTRQMAAAEFLDQLAADLDELRGLGFQLPRAASEYFADWVRMRILVRRPGTGRDETVELSPEAQDAIKYAVGLGSRRSRVTASRLANVSDLLARLARDTDTRQEERLQALLAERAVIDEQIRQVEAGEYRPIDDDTAIERLDEVLRLASEIPDDFARVSADFDTLNHDLREKIISSEGSRGDVLEQVFDGVDLIDESDEGKTFDAFYDMVLDPERAAVIDESIAHVLGRDFAATLTAQERSFLRGFLSALQRESNQVRSAMTGFARSLHAFVQTRAYQEHQQLTRAIAEAQSLLLELAHRANLISRTGYALPATAMSPSSVGAWTLYNPGDVRTVDPVKSSPVGTLDFAALQRQVRLSEIDFRELQTNVCDTLSRRQPATIGEVLAEHPATQGLASVVGLLTLAQSAGIVGSGTETLTWRSVSGAERVVAATRHLFTEVPDGWVVAR